MKSAGFQLSLAGVGLFLVSCSGTAEDLAATHASPVGSVEVLALEKPGFVVFEMDGRYWVFRDGSSELATFRRDGELAGLVTIVGQGPSGHTMRGPDEDTCREYMAACPGFYTTIVDGRVWVFRDGSDELAEFLEKGEPAKCLTLPGQGPMRMTLRGPDKETLEAYKQALGL